jgi:hypothetical protein
LPPRDFVTSIHILIVVIPLLTGPSKSLRIIRHDAVDAPPQAPAHEILLIHSPDEEGTVGGLNIGDEVGAARAHEHFLVDVEGDIGDPEELAGIGDREGDDGDGEGGEICVAERKIFSLSGLADLAVVHLSVTLMGRRIIINAVE